MHVLGVIGPITPSQQCLPIITCSAEVQSVKLFATTTSTFPFVAFLLQILIAKIRFLHQPDPALGGLGIYNAV